ncbi:helix-turn-helix domain-containing protein [Reyranella sp.]|uniref:helix-turn-helix domain-containing protein n=1 Tax=Reyranella sp. TaxID=1929291 RepID=UPI0011FB43C1|nr:helix-turn-helix domain-containing protein [Reyranella sp.]TAJ81859.1 MAG: helix-turn-helix domain-containing protein [Reyranella sp.]
MTDNVVPIKPPAISKEDGRQADRKWSPLVMKQGYTIVPVLLLHAQKRLGLSPPQLNVLLQIASHWWKAAQLPYPSKQLIANRMSCTPRQVQRHLTALENAGLIKRIVRKNTRQGQLSNEYSLAGLVKKLKEIAPEFEAEAEARRQNRAALEKRGGVKLRKA